MGQSIDTSDIGERNPEAGAGLVNVRISRHGQALASDASGASSPEGALQYSGRTLPVHPETRTAMRHLGRRAGAVVSVVPGGLLVKAHSAGPDALHLGGGKRGTVDGFSRGSHKRMTGKLMQIERWDSAFFTTLTYHKYEQWRGGAKQWHRDIEVFRKRFARRWRDRDGALWRLEIVERLSGDDIGMLAPHFHICMFWLRGRVPNLPLMRKWMAETWNDIVAPGDTEHLEAGTQVVRVRNGSGPQMGKLLNYVSKYMGKLQTHDALVDRVTGECVPTGRVWGIWGTLPTVVIAGLELTWQAFIEWTARLRTWGKKVGSWYLSNLSEKWAGFRLFGDGLLLLDTFDGIEGTAFV